jgi:hypothetical protein
MVCSCSMDMHDEHAPQTYRKDMHLGHAAWTSSMDMQQGQTAWKHAAWTCIMDMLHRQEERICSMDRQYRHAAWPCSMFLKQHWHGNISWRWTCIDMHQGHRHGHAARTSTWTYNRDVDMPRCSVCRKISCTSWSLLLTQICIQ